MIRVYRIALQPPHEGAPLVCEQMLAAHRYANDHVAIEKGRRAAVRALHDVPAVQEAIDALRAAARKERRDRLRALERARRDAERDARCAGGHWAVSEQDVDWYAYSPLYERERISLLDGAIRRGARALTSCYWGTYLGIEQSAEQVRASPLYEPNGMTPSDPRFQRWGAPELPHDGQIGVQIQGGLTVDALLDAANTKLRMVPTARGGRGELWMRVGSDGRAPIWAKWRTYTWPRQLPSGGLVKWAKVNRRREGLVEEWSLDLTIEMAETSHAISGASGAVALELMWSPLDDDRIRVGSWLDSEGQRGTIDVPARIVRALKKSSDIQAIRDVLLNELVADLQRRLAECREPLPRWLRESLTTIHLWRSAYRFHALVRRWRAERCDAAREAYDRLQEWELRDEHLLSYGHGARRGALRARLELYRVLARRWSTAYAAVLVPDRDLSREARWGDDSDVRFAAAPYELRECLRHAFGPRAMDVEWRGPHGVEDSDDEDAPTWLEMAIERWRGGEITGGARKRKKSSDNQDVGGGRWGRRAAAKAEHERIRGAAREAGGKAAE